MLTRALEAKGHDSEEYFEVMEEIDRLYQHVESAFDKHGVDILVFPINQKATTLAGKGGFPIVRHRQGSQTDFI